MRLRRQHGIQSGIPTVFSTETPKAGLLPFEAPGGTEANPSDYQVRVGLSEKCTREVWVSVRVRLSASYVTPA
jgi:hypothetical protein